MRGRESIVGSGSEGEKGRVRERGREREGERNGEREGETPVSDLRGRGRTRK